MFFGTFILLETESFHLFLSNTDVILAYQRMMRFKNLNGSLVLDNEKPSRPKISIKVVFAHRLSSKIVRKL